MVRALPGSCGARQRSQPQADEIVRLRTLPVPGSSAQAGTKQAGIAKFTECLPFFVFKLFMNSYNYGMGWAITKRKRRESTPCHVIHRFQRDVIESSKSEAGARVDVAATLTWTRLGQPNSSPALPLRARLPPAAARALSFSS